ncbi:MAG: cation-transporting P-type ATPase, partial [Pseudomonadota bacterium]
MQSQTSTDAAAGAAPDLEKADIARVIGALGVDPAAGLGAGEAEKRLGTYGPNAIVEQEESLFHKVLGYFKGPIALIIEAAAIISAILGHWEDFIIISGLLIFNAGLDLWQDAKAS